jgi:hypothetical protein
MVLSSNCVTEVLSVGVPRSSRKYPAVLERCLAETAKWSRAASARDTEAAEATETIMVFRDAAHRGD